MTHFSQCTGGCNCGQVTFSVDTMVKDVYLCHCSICRKSTGSGAIAVTVVPKHQFAWNSGEKYIKSWEKPGHDWLKNFCSECGSPLPADNDDNTVFIPVGLIEQGAEHLKVKGHIFVDSKASWQVIPEGELQHPRALGSTDEA